MAYERHIRRKRVSAVRRAWLYCLLLALPTLIFVSILLYQHEVSMAPTILVFVCLVIYLLFIAATMIESLIRQNNSAGRPTVLGLPTGSTPVGLYRELIRLHREQGLDLVVGPVQGPGLARLLLALAPQFQRGLDERLGLGLPQLRVHD